MYWIEEEDDGKKTNEVSLLKYVLGSRQEVEEVTSWVGRRDAIPVNSRLICGYDRQQG
jgi:hypothetical protein